MNTMKAIRERLGVTQAVLAEGMGCSQGNVSFYEKGQTVPPDAAKQLIVYAKRHGLDLTMDHVYGLVALPKTVNAAGLTHAKASGQQRREGPTNITGGKPSNRRDR